MIAGGCHGQWGVLENGFAVMLNLADLAMHDFAGAHDVSTERRANRLMPQAHAKHRLSAGKMPDQINADTRLLRRAGPRRNQNVARIQLLDLFTSGLVVAPHLDGFTKFTQILNKVVSKRVVVVEDKHHLGIKFNKFKTPANDMKCASGHGWM